MASPPNVLQLKTNAELQFFIDNPAYYQPELVAAARRELRRRLPAQAPAAQVAPSARSVAEPVAGSAEMLTAYHEAPRQRRWLLPGAATLVLAVAVLGFWRKQPLAVAKSPTPSASTKAPATAMASKTLPLADPLKLETAVSSPIPYYDTEGYVDKALALVPAAEKKNDQLVSQYRAISRRFWAAQNPTAHLIRQAQQGKANPVFGAQVSVVLGQWHDLSRVLVYSYRFDPVMADHLDRMKIISQYQRSALLDLAKDCDTEQPPHLDEKRPLHEQQEVVHLLAPLMHKTGSVTIHL